MKMDQQRPLLTAIDFAARRMGKFTAGLFISVSNLLRSRTRHG
jgi:hypothetical protein